MKKIAFANQKGGVGKTTTVQNLAAALHRLGKKMLIVDLDAQANLTDAVGHKPNPESPDYAAQISRPTVFDLLEGKAAATDAILEIRPGFDIIPATARLAEADVAFAGRMSRERLLFGALEGLTDYDFIFFDCPPNLGLVTVNALTAANSIIIPVQGEYHALAGTELIKSTIHDIRKLLNRDLIIEGILVTLFDKRTRLGRDVRNALRKDDGDLVFSAYIHKVIALAEAPSYSQDIFEYSPTSIAALDYAALAKEFLSRQPA